MINPRLINVLYHTSSFFCCAIFRIHFQAKESGKFGNRVSREGRVKGGRRMKAEGRARKNSELLEKCSASLKRRENLTRQIFSRTQLFCRTNESAPN